MGGKLREEEEEIALEAMSYAGRRAYLKDLVLERRKREEDQARMIIEDDHSKAFHREYIILEVDIS